MKGKDTLPYLAQTYRQLYIVPGTEGSADLYKATVLRGLDVTDGNLDHFIMHEDDHTEMLATPAGEVQVVVLHERRDFETFMYIMGNKCQPYEIPATQGASILDGLINWKKIRNHEAAWQKEMEEKNVALPDWGAEFKRFTSDKKNYKDALIILSAGPYSNIPAKTLELDEEEWSRLSLIIRQYHECTHFLCRRKYPEQINAVWDEIVADAVGIYAALGRFDKKMESVFLGINKNGYTGGRLENYIKEDEDIQALAAKTYTVLEKIEDLCNRQKPDSPFSLAIMLEEVQGQWW